MTSVIVATNIDFEFQHNFTSPFSRSSVNVNEPSRWLFHHGALLDI